MDKTRLVQITRQNKIAEEDFNQMINAIYVRIWENLLPPQVLTDDLTSRVAFNVVTAADAPAPDCMTCGACCAALPCVGVRPDEQVPAEDFWDITIDGDTVVDRFVRRNEENFACVALEGTLGAEVACRIYENRPRICHLFEAGSDKCHALRRAYGFEPFLTIEEMLEAIDKIDARNAAAPENPEAIAEVKFSLQTETGHVEINVRLKDNSTRTIHVFDPQRESWRQFEFDALTLSEAKELIESRKHITRKQ